MRFIAILMASKSGMSVKGLVTWRETENFVERFSFLIWERKEKVSLEE